MAGTKETSLGDEALQGLEEAIRSESPGIEIVDFLGWRVFVEANSVPIYVRGRCTHAAVAFGNARGRT
jgi:hypothetical protein